MAANDAARQSQGGLAVASSVVLSWGLALRLSLFSARVSDGPLALWLLAAAATTWLYTAVFITAHDAMHGLVCPTRPKLNHAIGWLCARSFAHLDYGTLYHAHRAHHRNPGVPKLDPDFHDGAHRGALRWFATFMLRYISVSQLVWMGLTCWLLAAALSPTRVLVGWVLPLVVSSVQLFYYGTYLPHRDPDLSDGAPFADHHRARSEYRWGSAAHIVTCLNFGLHREHHCLPHVPWWRLHTMRFDRRGLPRRGDRGPRGKAVIQQ